jgi:hypothetical protein
MLDVVGYVFFYRLYYVGCFVGNAVFSVDNAGCIVGIVVVSLGKCWLYCR